MMQTEITNVVPLPQKKRTYGIQNAETAMNVIRDEIYGKDIELLSKRVGVTPSCLFAIRSGRTKWPRPHTFFGLISALDLEMILRRKS